MGDRVVVFDAKQETLAIERETLAGLDVELEQSAADTEAAVIDRARGAAVIMVDAGVPITERVLAELDTLAGVIRAGIGYDNIDVGAARQRGVRVANVPDYCLEEVSTHAVALLLALARELRTYAAGTEAGAWAWEAGKPLHRLTERTLGIVGFGRLGRRTAEKAAPHFGEIVAYDPYVPDEDLVDAGVTPASFEGLLAGADAVSVHTPLTDGTVGLFDAEAFDAMTDGTLLVNTSRGRVIDEPALLRALEAGTVRAAGLDVLASEPPEDPRLLERDDVIVTPHVGWYSEASQREVRRKAAEEARRLLEGSPLRSPVGQEPWR